MLLTNRRYQFITIALAGMEIATYLPMALLAWLLVVRSQADGGTMGSAAAALGISPLLAVGSCLLLWLLYLFLTDLINASRIETPRRELVLFGTMLLTTLLIVRFALYTDASLLDFGWIRTTIGAVFNFTDGWRMEVLVVLLNIFLWVRVILSLGRSLTFMSVGLRFRLSLLLAVIANAILYSVSGLEQPLQYFSLLLAFGLLAVALARIDEKATVGHHSSGSGLSWPRLGLLAAAVAAAVGTGLLLTGVYTTRNIVAALAWLSPLWAFLGGIVMGILSAIFWLLAPIMEWIIERLKQAMEGLEPFQVQQETGSGDLETVPLEEVQTFAQLLENWTLVRYCLVTLVLVAMLAFLWIFFVRPYLQPRTSEAEELEQASANLGLGGLRSGLDRLRNLAKLVGRFGLSLELLDAINIENMYANLGRIARQRGYPRQPNQPPDEYIHELNQAFPSQADGLQQITSAYMRVHYGEQTIPRPELSRLRETYQAIQATPAPIEVE